MNKRILSAVLCAVLFSNALSFQTSAASMQSSEIKKSERVTYIITLDCPSLLDYVNRSDVKYKKVNELILSESGREYTKKILDRQAEIKSVILNKLPDADFSNSLTYTALTNGFTFDADISDIKVLRNIDGISSVSVSQSTRLPSKVKKASVTDDEPKISETYGDIYKASINTNGAYDKGYTGKNTLIAVIDSEFYTGHDIFSSVPENRKYGSNYIKKINAVTALNISDEYNTDDLFCNDKIIYAYDYGCNDNDCQQVDSYHGTHVAGIAAGNSGGNGKLDYKGVAYDSQLALFKVSDSEGILDDDSIVAALDDAVKLGPDVINCSFGARKYLIYDYEGKKLYQKLRDAGIPVVAAAGNNGYNGYDEGLKTPVEYKDYGVTCMPSAISSVLSVAATVPDEMYVNRRYLRFNEERDTDYRTIPLLYDDEFLSKYRSFKTTLPDDPEEGSNDEYISEEYEYIYLDSTGTYEELSELDIEEKIIIVNKSSLNPTTIMENVLELGGSGLAVIYDGELPKQDDDSMAYAEIYVIPEAEKAYLKDNAEGLVKVITSDVQLVRQPLPDAGKPADFSSAGVCSDLELKPDIAAPGAFMLSAAYYDEYSDMSGTSMASPCIAGSAAIVRQYISENKLDDYLSPAASEELIYKLLMSTAVPVVYHPEDGESIETLYYSPRSQGAGMADLGKAVTTEAYLAVSGERPKASLKESKYGEYSFDFTITNISEKTVKYSIDSVLQTDDYYKDNGKLYNKHTPVSIRDKASIEFIVNDKKTNEVTSAPGSETEVTVKITLEPEYVRQHSEIFTNGFYTDGFIMLTSEDGVDLSLPFTGFCGDWAKAPVFSNTVYDSEKTYPDLGGCLSAAMLIGKKHIKKLDLGVNKFGYNDLPSEISFGSYSLGKYIYGEDYVDENGSALLPNIVLLRDTLDYTITIQDTAGNVIYNQNYGSVPAYFSRAYQPVDNFEDENYRELVVDAEKFFKELFESKYTYTVTASTIDVNGNPGRSESRSFDISVDNTSPEIIRSYLEKTKEGRLLLNVEAFDNGCIQGIELFALNSDGSGTEDCKKDIYDEYVSYMSDSFASYSYDEESRLYTFTYDLTDYKSFINDKKSDGDIDYYDDDNIIIEFDNENDFSEVSDSIIGIRAIDFAYNYSDMQTICLENYGSLKLKLKDKNGNALSGITVKVNNIKLRSDSSGIIEMADLPIGDIRLVIEDKYYELADGSDFAVITLTENDYSLSKTIVLREKQNDSIVTDRPLDRSSISRTDKESDKFVITEKSNKSETSKTTRTYTKDNTAVFSTGDNNNVTVFVFLLCLSGFMCLFVLLTGRKNDKKYL